MKLINILLFWILTFPLLAQSQPQKLLDVIDQLAQKHEVVFSYNQALVQNVKVTPQESSHELTLVLQHLSRITAFDFEQIDAYNVLVKAKQKGKNLKLCLRILDADSKEVLFGATVHDAKKQNGFTANADGEGSLYINLNEWDVVHINYLGYEPKVIPISRFNGVPTCPTITLEPSTKALEEVEVVAYMAAGLDYNHRDQSIRLTPSTAALLPGETEVDVLTSLDALPGISSPDGKAGNLVIRGDDPDKTLLTFDDIPIYHKGHYFGTFSPFNANVIEAVTVHRSGYAADRGGRVGGSVEIQSKNQIPTKAESGIGLATTYVSGYTHIPLIKDKFSILLGGRSNYPFNWDSPKIEAINDYIYAGVDFKRAIDDPQPRDKMEYRFHDVNIKSIYKLGEHHQLSASFLNIYSDLDALFHLNQSANADLVKLQNWGINLSWKSQWSERLSTTQSFIQSRLEQRFFSRDVSLVSDEIESSEFKNLVDDLQLKFAGNYLLGEGKSIDFGYQWHRHDTRFFNQDIADTLNNIKRRTNQAQIHSLFTDLMITQEKFDIGIGLRASHYDLTNRFYIEPRLSANYYVNEVWTLKTNMGLYNQFINQIAGTTGSSLTGITSLNWQLSNGMTIPVLHSRQLMIGGMMEKNDWLVDVEAYYKDTRNLTINVFEPAVRNSDELIYGDYTTKGVDVLVKRTWERFDSWVSYTIAETLLNFDSLADGPFRSIWDQSHIFNWVGGYHSKRWNVSVGWKYKTGLADLGTFKEGYLVGRANITFDGGGTNPGGGPGGGGGTGGGPGGGNGGGGGPGTGGGGNGGGPGAGGGGNGGNPNPGGGVGSETIELTEATSFPDHHQLDISISYKFGQNTHKPSGNIGLSLYNVYNNRPIVRESVTFIQGIGFAPSLMLNLRF
ncbi:MAG: TonB-dependent receptor [Flammeovirgaceae bacterium]